MLCIWQLSTLHTLGKKRKWGKGASVYCKMGKNRWFQWQKWYFLCLIVLLYIFSCTFFFLFKLWDFILYIYGWLENYFFSHNRPSYLQIFPTQTVLTSIRLGCHNYAGENVEIITQTRKNYIWKLYSYVILILVYNCLNTNKDHKTYCIIVPHMSNFRNKHSLSKN